MKKTRLVSLLLALMLLGTACGTANVTDDSETDVAEATDAPETELTDGLPEDLNYGDKVINILNMQYIISGPKDYDPNDSSNISQQDAAVQEANYYRRLAVEERLGVKLNFIEESTYRNIPNMVRQSVNSGSDDYDMVFTVANQQVTLAQEGLYLPISELPYVNLENPWWNKDYIESVSVNVNNPYILFGDITYNTVQRTCAVFFNKSMLETRLGMTDDDMYDLVLDGKWTIDKMTELASQVYEDDGDAVADAGDIHGLVSWESSAFEWMAFSAGLEFTTRDENGYPILGLNSEKAVELCDKLLSLFNGEHAFVADSNDGQVNIFAEGRSLFSVNRLFLADWTQLREMKDDYGIIPMPKFDENTNGYHSAVESYVQWGTVPVTTKDPEMVSAVAESMAYEGYLKVMPAYYETALKLKFTRGEDVDTETKIIDLIAKGARTDFLFINKLGGLGDIFVNIYNAGQNNFSSLYASNELAAKGRLAKLIEMDMENN